MELFAKRLTARLATCFLLAAVGCSETDDTGDDPVDSGTTTIPTYDSGTTPLPPYDAGTTPLPTLDAGTTPLPVVDSGTPVDAARPDSGANPVNDSGTTKPDASTTDGGFMFPDLFPVSDAGPAPVKDGGTGGRNVNGPCKDLNLICFDFVDMWINAECATCNSGKGCQGCAIPFAY